MDKSGTAETERKQEMKTPVLVGIVVTVHGVAVGSLMLIQGCGTTMTHPLPPEQETVMPPIEESIAEMDKTPSREGEPLVKSWPIKTRAYVVGKGDSLSAIAQKHGVAVAEIVALNGILKPNMIRAGQKLMIPEKGKVTASTPAKVSEPIGTDNVYVVRQGDSLSVIAVAYDTTVGAIKKTNNLSSDRIDVGQKLIIPRSPVEAEPPAVPVGTPISSKEAAPASAARMSISPASVKAEPVQPPKTVPRVEPKRVVTHSYKVGQDEDLGDVARMWNVSVKELQELNNLSGATLEPGQVIQIPINE